MIADVAPHRVWITRSLPGADRTAQALLALGLEPVVAPLLTIDADYRPDIDPVVPLKAWALAFTSPNAVDAYVRHGLPPVEKPVFAVGDATAGAARDAGFANVTSAAGDVKTLAALVRARHDGRSGALVAFTALEPAGDLGAMLGGVVTVQSIATHRMVETGAPPPAGVDAALIHSPRAARTLADLGAPTSPPLIVAVSEAAAAPLRPLCPRLCVAETPTEASMLTLLQAALGKPGASV